MSIELPKPVAASFAAESAGDAGALARCFASDGVVHDEGGSFTGRAAIERWNADARAKYHHTVEPLGVTKRDGAIVVSVECPASSPVVRSNSNMCSASTAKRSRRWRSVNGIR